MHPGSAAVMRGQQPLCRSVTAAGIHFLVLFWALPLPAHTKRILGQGTA